MEIENEAFKLLYHKAIRILSGREHSTNELRYKLLAKETDEDLVEQVIDLLKKQKYLNDRRYVESYCMSRINRGYGSAKIRYELKQKGIKGSMLDDVLAEIDEDLWQQAIIKQISRKVADAALSFPDKMKLFRSLANRGFEQQQIQNAWEDYRQTR